MASKRGGYRFAAIGFVIATNVCWVVPAPAEDSLFSSDEMLQLTIRAPLESLLHDTEDSDHVAGLLELAEGDNVAVTISPYGLSRLRECSLPLLKIDVEERDVGSTLFAGFDTIRLVTPCHLSSTFDKYVLLEYLAYASYAVVADTALRVRLVSCRFLDTERKSVKHTGLAFFVEDINAAARRNEKAWLNLDSQTLDDLDLEQLATLAVFQFMVGNTDWSAVAAVEGTRCCHNVAALGAEGDRYNTLLPFDFDQAGLVDAPYAQPDRQFAIRSVTQRVYRGFCAHNDHLSAAITVFNQRRPELERLFNQEGLPEPKTRKQALKYVESFYDTINNPQKLKRRVIRNCR